MSVSLILSQLSQAIERTYQCKSYSDKDMDIGILVLRIGGPRLVYALNQAGLIPSKSVISKALQNKLPSFYHSFEESLISVIKKNIAAILKTRGIQFF